MKIEEVTKSDLLSREFMQEVFDERRNRKRRKHSQPNGQSKRVEGIYRI